MKDLAIKAKAQARESGPGSPRASGSPRSDVGEIDTRAPFQSVKAAVTLFGDGSPKSASPVVKKSNAEERVLEKETQHQIMMRERGYYTNQLKNAEAAKAEALRELQRANNTLKLLTNKLQALSESKQASIKAAEAAKITIKELEGYRARRAKLGEDAWKVDLNEERERFKVTTAELVSSKREISMLKEDYDAESATKSIVFQKAEEAEHKAQMILERESKLSKEVDEIREALEQVKLVSLQAQQEFSKLMEEKEKALVSLKSSKEETDNEIRRLTDEYIPADALQEKLEETMEAIRVLQDKLHEVQSSDLYIIRKMASELNGARKALQEAIAEEHSLKSAVDSYKHEIEHVKKKVHGSEKKALKAEAIVHKKEAELEKKQAELERREDELENAMSSSIKYAIEEHLEEAEKAKREAEESIKSAKLLKQEAEAAKIATKETQEKLEIALKEAEAAKAAEKLTEEQVHTYSIAESAESQLRTIKISVEEFELMNNKIEQLKNEADLKVAAANAQAEAINAREKEISQQLAELLKENEAILSETEGALKRAKNAEAAKTMVEGELQKWRQMERHQVGKTSKRKMLISY